jgi:hypothetical protein
MTLDNGTATPPETKSKTEPRRYVVLLELEATERGRHLRVVAEVLATGADAAMRRVYEREKDTLPEEGKLVAVAARSWQSRAYAMKPVKETRLVLS